MASNSSPQQMVVESKNLRQKLVIFIPNQERVNHERKRTFKKGRRWRNGVEGRISFCLIIPRVSPR